MTKAHNIFLLVKFCIGNNIFQDSIMRIPCPQDSFQATSVPSYQCFDISGFVLDSTENSVVTAFLQLLLVMLYDIVPGLH